MEAIWFIVVVTLCISILGKALFDVLFKTTQTGNNKPNRLPPGSLHISNLTYIYKYPSVHGLLQLATDHLRRGLGPIFTIYIGSRPYVFLSDQALAHQALVLHGSSTSDRLAAGPVTKAVSIGAAPYGPTWTALRRNLTPHFVNPATLRELEPVRVWALETLFDSLQAHEEPIQIKEDLYFSMFCLQISSCFGFQLHDQKHVRRVMHVIRSNVESPKFRILSYYPKLAPFLFRSRWRRLHENNRREEEILIPLIRARLGRETIKDADLVSRCYVDKLTELRLPDGRGPTELEMMSLCSIFMFASTELPACEVEWIMAELVRNPRVQAKLLEDIRENNTSLSSSRILREEDIERMRYLKAVVKEGLRLHPPGHLMIPHRVEEEVEVGGYTLPKDTVFNVLLAEVGRDPTVWEEPLEFRPERWLVEDEGSSKAVTAFGWGRRKCPGMEMALLNLECFVGNLVWWFEWEAPEGCNVDMTEKEQFVIAMKTPLKAKLTYKFNQSEMLVATI